MFGLKLKVLYHVMVLHPFLVVCVCLTLLQTTTLGMTANEMWKKGAALNYKKQKYD